ncbi:MAG: hypothetical protein OK438_06570 [Thaumarchaeota archaeon]|nr:hypothetical protein [Nitrososphaerota archaeon]
MNPLPGILQSVAVSSESISPNTGPSLENVVFDPTYYGLTALIIIVALTAAIFALRVRVKFNDQGQRARATGTGLAALGFAIVFVGATSFLALLRAGLLGGFLYQQAQFMIVYVGAAMMLYGVDRTVIPVAGIGSQSQRAGRETKLRAVLWIAFVVSVVIAVAYLFSPSTYTVTVSGATQHVAQQGAFWLPPFVTFAAGAVGLPVFALRGKDAAIRRHAMWFGLFFALELFGVLRESTLIPSSGDPFVDLLVAFIPFTAGGFCLIASAMSLPSTWLRQTTELEAALHLPS